MHFREFTLAILAVAALAPLLAPPLASHARADALNDYLGPRELALGDSLRADSRGSLAATLNPSGLALARELVFEGSYGHRFSDGADAITLSGCDSTVAVPGCFYYRYFSAAPEVGATPLSARVHEGGAAFARLISSSIMVGVNVKYFDFHSDAAAEDTSGFTFDVGATVQPMSAVSIALVSYHLYGASSGQYPRALAAGLLLRPLPRLSLSADGLWNTEVDDGQSTGRYGGGIEYFMLSSDRQTGYPIRVGAVHDVANDGTYLSAGVGLLAAKVALDVGARRQIQGGDELVVVASLRIFGPRQIPGTAEYR